MTNKTDLQNDRIPLVEFVCPDCGATLLVPMCPECPNGIIICPCCCPTTPCV